MVTKMLLVQEKRIQNRKQVYCYINKILRRAIKISAKAVPITLLLTILNAIL